MKRNLAWSLVFLLGVSALAARADEWNKSYKLAGKPDVRVDVEDGDITVVASAGGQVNATVTTRGWKLGPEGVRILEEQDGNHVQIEVKVPHHWTVGVHSVKVELDVPAEADLDLHSGDGDLSLMGVKGHLRLSTGDGNIDGTSLDGPLFAHTGDGNLKLEGRVEDLDAATGDGNIKVEAAAGSRMGAGWTLHTGDGSLTLRCADDLAADLDAHTGDGKVTTDFPMTVSGEIREGTLAGKLNGGGPPLLLRSGDGDIRIEKF